MGNQKRVMESMGLRRRKQLWPEAEQMVFKPKEEKGYIPLPFVVRELMRFMSPPQFRLYVYLCLRADQHFICWPTLEEIADALALSSRRKLTPHLNWLEEHGFVATKTQGGKKFFLIHILTDGHLAMINELLEKVGQELIAPKPKLVKMPITG